MKVAVVTKYFPTPTHPWAGHSSFQTLRKLAPRCDLHVFYPLSTYPRFLKPENAFGRDAKSEWSQSDVQASYVPSPTLPVVSRPFNGFVMGNRLLPHVRRFQPDIILNYIVYPDGYAAVRIGHALGVPVVLTAIGSDLNNMADPICARLTRSALQRANCVTTVSRDLAKTAVAMGANPATTRAILNGCDTSLFHPRDAAAARTELGLDATGDIIVYLGRLSILKGLLELIESVNALRAERPSLRCYIVGDGPDRTPIHDAIVRFDAGESIKVMPACSTLEVATWTAAATLVALPSYNEGCPNVVVEALASGRPVVASRVGGIPELMDDSCGRLVPPRDVPALTQALEEVLSQTWGASLIHERHNRNWTNVADDLFEVLESTLAQYAREKSTQQ